MLFFDRIVRFEAGPAGVLGLSWGGVRIGFRVEKTDSREPNRATVQLYNLTAASRGYLQTPGLKVCLYAGYRNDIGMPPPLIFQGDLAKRDAIKVSRNGMDIVTEVSAEDGGQAYREAKLNLAMRGPVTVQQVVAMIATAMGLKPPASLATLPPLRFGRRFCAQGPAREILDGIVSSLGARWSIQDGELVVTPDGMPLPGAAFVLSSATGLVGSPEKTEDGKGVKAVSLMNGLIRPRSPFVVMSQFVNGTYIAKAVTHAGDNGWQADYYTIIEGVAP